MLLGVLVIVPFIVSILVCLALVAGPVPRASVSTVPDGGVVKPDVLEDSVAEADVLEAVAGAVLISRSALSDPGLIADLFKKMLLNWSSFCLKSPLFGLNSPKSLIFTF